ncbi:MAG: outer membrane lipoprotein-sorting protein [Fibrobacterales bacterium]
MRILFILLILAILPSFALTVDQILDKVEANEEPQSAKSDMIQISYPSSGTSRESKLISYSADKGDKGFMEYTSPKSVKGMKMLSLNDGDEIWVYFPRTNRKRKIAGSSRKGSMNGSDFSYEDMSQSDKRKDYTYKIIGEENKLNRECWKIEAIAKDADDETYSKLVQWVDKERFIGLVVEFYDEDGELWKELTMKGVAKLGNYWTASTIEMKNIQKGSRTVIKTSKQEFDISIPKSIFTQRNLGK